MPNNHLPSGWGNQQNSPPKGWEKSPSAHTKPKTQLPTKAMEDVHDIQPKSNELDNPKSDNPSFNTESNQNKTIDSFDTAITSVNEEETTDISKDYKDSYDKFVVQEIEKDINKKNCKSSEDKKPKTLRISTLVLAVILTATISFLIVFICLYFRSNKDENTSNVETTAIIETTEEITEKITEEVTEQETTEAETTEPTTVEETTVEQEATYDYSDYNYPDEKFESYTIKVINRVSIRTGPSYSYNSTGELTDFTKYTIVDEDYDDNGELWGKLESGIGWICISDATENWGFYANSSYYNPNKNPDMKTKTVGDFVFCYYPLSPSEAIEGDYFEKIDSVDISQIGDYTFRIHIKGEVNDEYGLDKQIWYFEMDNNCNLLETYCFNESITSNEFDYNTTIALENKNTKYIYIGIRYY